MPRREDAEVWAEAEGLFAERWREPTDNELAAAIRSAAGLPPSTSVPPVAIDMYRRGLRGAAVRVVVALLLGLDLAPLGDSPEADAEAVDRRLHNLLHRLPLLLLLLRCLDLPREVLGLPPPLLPPGRYQVLGPSALGMAAPLHDYVTSKIGGLPWTAYGGRGGVAYPGAGGPAIRLLSPRAAGPDPLHLAAVNACTPARVRAWLSELDTRSDPHIRRLLSELAAVGRQAILRLAPLPVWLPEPGAPRGLVPDAPVSPPAQPAATGVVAPP